MAIPGIVLFPHCDLHVAHHGAPDLRLRVMLRDTTTNPPDPLRYRLNDVTSQCTFDFFAPYREGAARLDPLQLPIVDPNDPVVRAPTLGVYLFVVHFQNFYLTARLQVHDTILGWWFGNSSITTALDSHVADAQPSLYALFSDDPVRTDLVGDITGHGYVNLSSLAPNLFSVNTDGRLHGRAVGDGKLRGDFLGVTHDLDVRVVDHVSNRRTLDAVRVRDLANASEQHNLVFVAEGFRASEKDKFDSIVTRVVDEMFCKPRHAPYNLLEGSFNVWKAFEPSQQHGLTCGFRVTDSKAGSIEKGSPIPHPRFLTKDGTKYSVEMLVQRVGLPLREETQTTSQLITLWKSLGLPDFDETHVLPEVVTAWKGQTSLGILEARDTVFGFMLGQRYADRSSSTGVRILPDQDLTSFIRRLYEWFTIEPSRVLQPDPRRHAPERFADLELNPGMGLMRYLASLSWRFAPHPNIGQEWVPSASTFKPSRGLVMVVAQEGMTGGAGVNQVTITTTSVAKGSTVPFEYANAGNERVMRRKIPEKISADVDEVINTVAHEMGHSFMLDDEYEVTPGNDPHAEENASSDTGFDNTTRLAAIFANGTVQPPPVDKVTLHGNEIDPDKVKWFQLVRARISSVLIEDLRPAPNNRGILVTIDKRFIAPWVDAEKKKWPAHLRRRDISPGGLQLPFKLTDEFYLIDLKIGPIDETKGIIELGGPSLPKPPFTVFPRGSLLFIPLRDEHEEPRVVVEQAVLEILADTRRPLNKSTDVASVNNKEDCPIDIAGFKPPCKSYKLIGLYEGASEFAGRMFRPAGLCKMRSQGELETPTLGINYGGEFCHVCKYLIVHRVDPGLHSVLDHNYFPEAK